jgi:hypothetical protein
MIKKLSIAHYGLRACASLLENIRSDSEYGFATASFIGHEHLEPLDLWGGKRQSYKKCCLRETVAVLRHQDDIV